MTRYPSKRDTWAVALLAASAVLCLGAAGLVWINPLPLALKVGFLVVCLAGAGVSLSFLVRTYYDLRSDVLFVRHGLLSWRIPLDTIKKVSPARNYFSSAALSRDKLRIQYGKGYHEIYISPRDRAGFLQQLNTLNPAIEIEGGVGRG